MPGTGSGSHPRAARGQRGGERLGPPGAVGALITWFQAVRNGVCGVTRTPEAAAVAAAALCDPPAARSAVPLPARAAGPTRTTITRP